MRHANMEHLKAQQLRLPGTEQVSKSHIAHGALIGSGWLWHLPTHGHSRSDGRNTHGKRAVIWVIVIHLYLLGSQSIIFV